MSEEIKTQQEYLQELETVKKDPKAKKYWWYPSLLTITNEEFFKCMETFDQIDKDKYFVSVDELLTFNDGVRDITLCHYPMVSFEGRFHIHGHIHGNTKDIFWDTLKKMDKVLNASVEINNFEPVTFDRLLINNRKFKNDN